MAYCASSQKLHKSWHPHGKMYINIKQLDYCQNYYTVAEKIESYVLIGSIIF